MGVKNFGEIIRFGKSKPYRALFAGGPGLPNLLTVPMSFTQLLRDLHKPQWLHKLCKMHTTRVHSDDYIVHFEKFKAPTLDPVKI